MKKKKLIFFFKCLFQWVDCCILYVFLPSWKPRFPVDWRVLIKERIANIDQLEDGWILKRFRQKWVLRNKKEKINATSHKIDYLAQVSISNDIIIASLIQKLRWFCWISGFFLLVQLHQEGSVINVATPSSQLFKTQPQMSALLFMLCFFDKLFVQNSVH